MLVVTAAVVASEELLSKVNKTDLLHQFLASTSTLEAERDQNSIKLRKLAFLCTGGFYCSFGSRSAGEKLAKISIKYCVLAASAWS